jgi:tRNA threonylcarbamoyladenosine modification (KEOPS) complex  Pcc1 subunit
MHNRIAALGWTVVIAGFLGACSDAAAPSAAADTEVPALSSGSSSAVVVGLRGSAAFPAAHGKAKFDNRGARRELEIEAEDIRRLNGATVSFFLAGVKIGQARVALGATRLELSTQRGQAVPTSVAGKQVQIRTAAGVVIVTGSF